MKHTTETLVSFETKYNTQYNMSSYVRKAFRKVLISAEIFIER